MGRSKGGEGVILLGFVEHQKKKIIIIIKMNKVK
jgi:hypothetical protein